MNICICAAKHSEINKRRSNLNNMPNVLKEMKSNKQPRKPSRSGGRQAIANIFMSLRGLFNGATKFGSRTYQLEIISTCDATIRE